MKCSGFAAFALAFLSATVPLSARAGDSYTLALTWLPAFCTDNADRAECKNASAVQSPLVLHGLWPNWDVNGDGRQDGDDAYCLDAGPARDSVMRSDQGNGGGGDGGGGDGGWNDLPDVALSKAMKADLPAVMPGTLSHLDRHEWWKHGACSGLKPDDYFGAAILMTRQMQLGAFGKFLDAHKGQSVTLKELLAVFDREFGKGSARALKVGCDRAADGAASLVEIQIRLKRDRIADGLLASTLDTAGKAPKGKCGATVLIQPAQ